MQAREIWSADQGDDKGRFLADLRALRDTAALGYEELSARAHYPSDILKEAENGPALPGLPILAAYVRACEGDVPEWEERWRRLGYEAWADPRLPVRTAGASAAAVAGARAGIGIAPPDVYDPERIRAALRGQRGLADKGTAAAAQGRMNMDATGGARKEAPDGSAGWGTGTSNGDHQTGHRSDAVFDTSVTGTADHAGSPGSIRHDPFSSAWLQDSELAPSRTDSERRRPGRADGDPPAGQDSWFIPPNPPGSERGLRTSSAASADVQRPGPPPPPAGEQPIARASGPAPAETSPEVAPDLGHRTAPDLLQRAVSGPGGDLHQGAVPAQSRRPTEPAVPQTTVATASEPRRDRFFALRLLVVIVVAALIGSILVLLIK